MMLTVIDGTSKYAWAIPLKGKTGKEVTDAFKRILDESKRSPNKLWVDQGKEFYNKDFQALMDSKGITMYSTQSGLKSVFAESFNKTLKTKMYKSFTSTGTRRWVDFLDDLLNWYNTRTHSAINATPVYASTHPDVFEPEEKS